MVSRKTESRGVPVRRRIGIVVFLSALAWIVSDTQAFVNLWLTPDQQGRLWFQLGDYRRASRTFEDPRWRGFSLYAGQEFDEASSYFSQYYDAESLLIRANALAHQRKYSAAKRAYQELADRYPDHPALAVNVPVIEGLIEATRQASGDPESGKDRVARKPGKGSESSESDERQSMELEQLTADELLQDPGLTEMWLRQIQRDPSEFISTKFYLQLEQQQGDTP